MELAMGKAWSGSAGSIQKRSFLERVARVNRPW